MANVQLLLAMGVPTIMVLIGILLNRSDVAALRTELTQVRTDLTTLRTDLHKDMTTLRDSIHRDRIGLHERIAVVESKQA